MKRFSYSFAAVLTAMLASMIPGQQPGMVAAQFVGSGQFEWVSPANGNVLVECVGVGGHGSFKNGGGGGAYSSDIVAVKSGFTNGVPNGGKYNIDIGSQQSGKSGTDFHGYVFAECGSNSVVDGVRGRGGRAANGKGSVKTSGGAGGMGGVGQNDWSGAGGGSGSATANGGQGQDGPNPTTGGLGLGNGGNGGRLFPSALGSAPGIGGGGNAGDRSAGPCYGMVRITWR